MMPVHLPKSPLDGPLRPQFGGVSSERGIALVVVLLLTAVLSGLATGFAMTGQVESSMASNELYFAGTRAAAEAGMNRAIEAVTNNTDTNLLAGVDGAVDAADAGAAANADNGSLAFLLGAGPYDLGTTGEYSYDIEILDDDDGGLYESALTSDQLTQMGEDGSAYTSTNDRLILRATGWGPKGTTVRIARILESVDTQNVSTTTTSTISNPAIIVDGDLTISGNPTIDGSNGSVHANGDLSMTGSVFVEENATASETFSKTGSSTVGGEFGGGRPTITVPSIIAANYQQYATHLLKANGTVVLVSTGAVVAKTGWTLSGTTWQISGNSATSGAYYVEAGYDAKVSGNPGSAKSPLQLSIIATGSIEVSGNPYLRPHSNTPNLQFVAQKDLKLAGNVDVDVATVEGQSLVGEQLMISGNPDIRGQIIVKNATSTSSLVDNNTISGNPTITYNGSFGGLTTTTTTTSTGATTYVNNVSGWLEQ